ncbi:MAG: ankyrin repeat domain-containing protein [Chlamydiota bacterium]|nr:ankyrin repeat domain-containing protein [Chlamydiota bacterium]
MIHQNLFSRLCDSTYHLLYDRSPHPYWYWVKNSSEIEIISVFENYPSVIKNLNKELKAVPLNFDYADFTTEKTTRVIEKALYCISSLDCRQSTMNRVTTHLCRNSRVITPKATSSEPLQRHIDLQYLINISFDRNDEEYTITLLEQFLYLDLFSILLKACQEEKAKVVQYILKKNRKLANKDANRGGWPPLYYACVNGNLQIANILCKHGANINALDGYGKTLLHYLRRFSNETISYLLSKRANPFALDSKNHAPIEYVDNKKLRCFIDAGIDFNTIFNKETILHKMARRGQIEQIDTLLTAKVNPNIKNANGQTALHVAIETRNQEIAIMLINRGAKVYIPDDYGITPVRLAFKNGLRFVLLKVFQSYDTFFRRLQRTQFHSILEKIAEKYHKYVNPNTPLELAFLLNEPSICRGFFENCLPSEMSIYIDKLKIAYGEEGENFIKESLLIVNTSHFFDKELTTKLPLTPDVHYNKLMDVLKEIHSPNNQIKFWVAPKIQKREISKIIKILDLKTPNIGTPKKGTKELHVFYDNLRLMFRHITKSLLEMDDLQNKANIIQNLTLQSQACGGRWIGEAHLLYRSLKLEMPPESFQGKIFYELQNIRTDLIRNMISEGDSHSYDQSMHCFGEILNLSCSQILTDFQDPIASFSENLDEDLDNFYARYNPATLITKVRNVLFEMSRKLETADLVVQWFMDNTPSSWKQEKRNRLTKMLTRMEKNNINAEEIHRTIFLKHRIHKDSSVSYRVAIRNHFAYNFLNEKIYEQDQDGNPTGKFSRYAARYMLETMGVLEPAIERPFLNTSWVQNKKVKSS